jgi:hypothetical protein
MHLGTARAMLISVERIAVVLQLVIARSWETVDVNVPFR